MIILAQSIDFSLPLKNPVLIFSLLLFIILFAPIILNRIKIPHLIGLIIAGVMIGPNGFNLMLRDSSIVLFGTVGLLYIMFLAGIEIDLADFKKNSLKSLYFGMLTFLIPMGIGIYVGLYLLHFQLYSSILLASLFASHTLITYPIISKMGLAKNKAVGIAIGGTMITDTLALLVLAVIVGISTGEVTDAFWWRLGISFVVFCGIVLLGFPILSRWFMKKFNDSVSQYIFVLGMVFLSAFLAEAAGIEAIIGAFMAGLALNRLIPQTSPLMNRVEFVGNALFIPFFLIGVGMLVDLKVFIQDLNTIKVAVAMTLSATIAKFIAAYLTQKTFRFSTDERRLIFGLSNSQAAATLAAVLIGYNIILNGEEIAAGLSKGIVIQPVRLLNESVLNGSILMILITCTIASFITQKGAQNLALSEQSVEDEDNGEIHEKILIPLNRPEQIEEIVIMGVTLKAKSNKSGLYALNIIEQDKDTTAEKNAKKILELAAKAAASTDNNIHTLLRYDINTVNGISSVVREHKITDILLLVNQNKGMSDSFLKNLSEGILSKCNATTFIYKPSQPLSTIKRQLIVIPEKAEKEIGFLFWVIKIWNLARNTSGKLVFYASESTLKYIREIQSKHPIECTFNQFESWEDFLIISREIQPDDNLIIVMSRKERPSFHGNMGRIPSYLNKYFHSTSYMLVYPIQKGVDENFQIGLNNPSILEPLETLDDIGKTITGIFKRK